MLFAEFKILNISPFYSKIHNFMAALNFSHVLSV